MSVRSTSSAWTAITVTFSLSPVMMSWKPRKCWLVSTSFEAFRCHRTSRYCWSAAPFTQTVPAGDGTGAPLIVIPAELLAVEVGALELLVDCGVDGVEDGEDGFVLGPVLLLDGAEPGLELGADDEAGPPRLRLRIGVGLELGVDGGGADVSWFAVLLPAAGGGLNTWFTVVPSSQPSGSHGVAEELGVELGLLGLAGLLELGGVEGLAGDVPVGTGALGVAVPEGAGGACGGGLAGGPGLRGGLGTDI